MIAVVDTGPLYAVVDANDRHHHVAMEVLQRDDLDLVVSPLVVAEAAYLIEARLGPRVEAEFLRGLSTFEIEMLLPEDWEAMATLVERYADFPLGTVDASVAVLADRLETDLVVTHDRRHFGALRSNIGRPYRLLPDWPDRPAVTPR